MCVCVWMGECAELSVQLSYTRDFRTIGPPTAAIRDLLGLGGLRDLQKFRGPVRGPKLAGNTKKWISPVLGVVLGETSADQICLRANYGPSGPCLGSHVFLGPGIWPFWGALGAISSGRDRFCRLGTQPTKLRFGCNPAPLARFRECFGSSEPRLRCATFLLWR